MEDPGLPLHQGGPYVLWDTQVAVALRRLNVANVTPLSVVPVQTGATAIYRPSVLRVCHRSNMAACLL